jgi:hypothetical protein
MVPGSDQHGEDPTPPPRSLYERSPLLQTLGDIASGNVGLRRAIIRPKYTRFYGRAWWALVPPAVFVVVVSVIEWIR